MVWKQIKCTFSLYQDKLWLANCGSKSLTAAELKFVERRTGDAGSGNSEAAAAAWRASNQQLWLSAAARRVQPATGGKIGGETLVSCLID